MSPLASHPTARQIALKAGLKKHGEAAYFEFGLYLDALIELRAAGVCSASQVIRTRNAYNVFGAVLTEQGILNPKPKPASIQTHKAGE